MCRSQVQELYMLHLLPTFIRRETLSLSISSQLRMVDLYRPTVIKFGVRAFDLPRAETALELTKLWCWTEVDPLRESLKGYRGQEYNFLIRITVLQLWATMGVCTRRIFSISMLWIRISRINGR